MRDITPGPGAEWFAVMVRPNFEQSVSELLKLKGYDRFLPLAPKRRQWSDRWKIVNFPLFPRYVFCRFRFDQRVPILNTPGVLKIVNFGDRPSPISAQEIETLRFITAAGAGIKECSYVPNGRHVRISRGPLAGVQGIFIEVKANCRVVVSIHLLQRSAYVEIDRDSIELLPEPSSVDGLQDIAQSA
jgi:transcription antitermination factor NusG